MEKQEKLALLTRIDENGPIPDAEPERQYYFMKKAKRLVMERQKQLELETQRLSEKAETDQLTGIANRYRMSRFTQEALERCRAEHIPLSYEILDIDYFKQYNDGYGHQAGDECVKAIAGLLVGIENENIFCARYGGDEFAIGLCEKDIKATEEKFKELVTCMDRPFVFEEKEVDLSISVGAVIVEEDVPYDDLFKAADDALYAVKEKGKNNYRMEYYKNMKDNQK